MHLLLDMYGVIVQESKGNFIPFVQSRFPVSRQALRELYLPASRGEMGSDGFFTAVGFENPQQAMRDYIEGHLHLDGGFVPFAKAFSKKFVFSLLSNDVLEWSEHIRRHFNIEQYFTNIVTSAHAGCRKPDNKIFSFALQQTGAAAWDCIFVDNSVQNLAAAEKAGMLPVLFNRDGEAYEGVTVTSFGGLGAYLEKLC